MLVSVAIPCYKSSSILPVVVSGIKRAFEDNPGYDYQLILVNDNSPDNNATLNAIKKLCLNDKKIIGVDLSRNFGQAAAKMAALPFVEGDILVYMDDDGQHSPDDIFKLVKAVEDGADMAIASFYGKKHSLFKRMTSSMNSSLLKIAINKPKDLQTSSFAAYSRFLIDRLKEYHSPFVSSFAYVLRFTSRVVNVPLRHHQRLEGKSGYTLKKLFKLFGDGILGFSMFPLRFIGTLSFIMGLASLVLFVCSIVMACLSMPFSTLLIIACVFFAACVILLGESIIAEYLGRSCLTQNQAPQYSVREVINDNR